jgi:hypothetical protein
MCARVVELDAESSIVDVSFGGFRARSRVAFEQGGEFTFLVNPKDGGAPMRIDATAMRCVVRTTSPALVFETGFAFAQGSWSTVGFQAFIDSVLSVLETC